MATVKEMRTRISAVKSTQKITKAMQMVAAAKLRRAQDAAQNARPYAERMAAVIANLAAGVSGDGAPKLLVGTGSDQRHLVVVATSDRGLAGGFNSSIVRAARERIDDAAGRGQGRQDHHRRPQGPRPAAPPVRRRAWSTPSRSAATRRWPSPRRSPRKIQELFEAGEVDVVTLFFSQFKSVVTQIPTGTPADPGRGRRGRRPPIDLKGAAYEYEPDEATILAELLPRNITTQIFSAMLENQAGFFAAQMTAMDNATRNAGDMIAASPCR